MIYLASPYSHPDPAVRQRRYEGACHAVVALLRTGQVVFSPIVHSHPLVARGLPGEWLFWEPIDRAYLARCDEVLVLKLDGWDVSVGVQTEIKMARASSKPVRFVEVDELAISECNNAR